MAEKTKQARKEQRKRRVRARIFGTAQRPRLSVYVSLTGMFAQIIDDEAGKTLVSANTVSGGNKTDQAAALGKLLAERAQTAGIKAVVFDRGSKKYHGRVKALAEAARAKGLIF